MIENINITYLMAKKERTSQILFLLVLISCSEKPIESRCDLESQNGQWFQGIGDDTVVNDIVKKFGQEHQQIVSTLDRLPLNATENNLISELGQNPKSKVSVIKDYSRLEWEVIGKNTDLDVIIQHFNGCIYQISLGETKNGKLINGGKYSFFHRKNKLKESLKNKISHYFDGQMMSNICVLINRLRDY